MIPEVRACSRYPVITAPTGVSTQRRSPAFSQVNGLQKAPTRTCRPSSMRPSTPRPCPRGQRHLPSRQVPQQAQVRRPRRRARPGLAARAAVASGDRLLRCPVDRAGSGRPCRHPGLSGGSHPLYRDTFRRLGLLSGQGTGQEADGPGGTAEGQQPTGKAGERFKVACGCQPPPVVLDPGQAVHLGTDHLRRLQPRFPTLGHRLATSSRVESQPGMP